MILTSARASPGRVVPARWALGPGPLGRKSRPGPKAMTVGSNLNPAGIFRAVSVVDSDITAELGFHDES